MVPSSFNVRIILLSFLAFLIAPSVCRAAVEFHGFAEFDYGLKVSDDTTKRDNFNLLEQRLQLKTTHLFNGENYWARKGARLFFKGDFIVDEYAAGSTDFDLREFNLSLTPLGWLDLKLGRQVLTWGTGDYLFINDMFPKDYVSFFVGRDDEYLKKPSDALRFSFYPQAVNVDFIMIPYFEPNTHDKGDRLSFFDSFQGGITGINSDRRLVSPSLRMSNNEYALRLYRNFGSSEGAFYFFHGFDKSPRSYKDEAARELYYEPLDVYGASLRGPFLNGIANAEIGYAYSRDDTDGTNRMVENSVLKTLSGYSKDLGNDFKIGLQYYYEQKMNYNAYRDNLLPQDYFWDECRHLLTTRLTKLYKNQTVMASLFVFYSPTDADGYVRPSLSYDVTDQWKIFLGANLPWGEDDITEFGQMKRNKNVTLRVRYSF